MMYHSCNLSIPDTIAFALIAKFPLLGIFFGMAYNTNQKFYDYDKIY